MLAITTDSVAHIVARRKPVIEHQPEIILGPQPMFLNKAPTGKVLSAEFLQDFAEHYHAEGKGIFWLMYQKAPTYFGALVQLAKVLKIEIGPPRL